MLKRWALIGVIGFVILIVIQGSMGTVFTVVNADLDQLSADLLVIAPKVAVASAAVGLVLLCTHWGRRHGQKMITAAFIAAIGAASLSALMAWAGTEGQGLTPTVTGIASELLGKVTSGVQQGVH